MRIRDTDREESIRGLVKSTKEGVGEIELERNIFNEGKINRVTRTIWIVCVGLRSNVTIQLAPISPRYDE